MANLPYNIATPLVADLLDKVPEIERMLVMVQQEVAQRLVAGPGSKAYGAVSVKVAYWAEASLVGTVPSSVFVPRPRVGSALVSLKRRRAALVDPAVVAPGELFSLVRTGFAQRRKMLRRALEACASRPKHSYEQGSTRSRGRKSCLLPTGAASPQPPAWVARERREAGGCGSGSLVAEVTAPAKLTLSLRVTGVRPDGYHLLDAEMVTRRPCRHAVLLRRRRFGGRRRRCKCGWSWRSANGRLQPRQQSPLTGGP